MWQEGFFGAYLKTLADRGDPRSRVVLKVALLAVATILVCVWYRHWELELDTLESVAETGILAVLIFVFLGLFGGVLTAALYGAFWEDVGATNSKPSIHTFVVEWCVALAAPGIALIFFVIVSNYG